MRTSAAEGQQTQRVLGSGHQRQQYWRQRPGLVARAYCAGPGAYPLQPQCSAVAMICKEVRT
jgi:hypothetical protein